MARDSESFRAEIRNLKAELGTVKRENRTRAEIMLDFEERYSAPADIEGSANRVAGLVYRDKNMGEFNRFVDNMPKMPGWHSKNDPNGPPIGFWEAVACVKDQGAKMLDSLYIVPPYTAAMVEDRHHLLMFLYNEAGKLVRPADDPIGKAARRTLKQMAERVAFAPSFSHLIGMSQETEVQPAEAERKGFG